MVLLGETA